MMSFKQLIKYFVILSTILIALDLFMCQMFPMFRRRGEEDRRGVTLDDERMHESRNRSFSCGLYYSNWSAYEPRLHFPHEINFDHISHVYYAFFLVDGKNGKLVSGDKWADFQRPILKNNKLVKGNVGELFDLKMKNRVKCIMCIGGWSNREAWHIFSTDPSKIESFTEQAVKMMFEYGFDGIDLDWEYPEDDGIEPQLYLEIMRRIKHHMNKLESEIFKDTSATTSYFELSVATPAFKDKLEIFPLKEMDTVIDYWNMMTYDYYGEWSERTGYHSNLYDGSKGSTTIESVLRHGMSEVEGLNGDYAVKYMINQGIKKDKIILGMAAYGRGFTNVDVPTPRPNESPRYIGRTFDGVGGASEGEPGMWRYDQLPIPGTVEQFDPRYVSGYCFEPTTGTFVGYDTIDSVRVKTQYIKMKDIGGGFWWESCGDTHKNPERSLVNAYVKELGRDNIKKPESIYKNLHCVSHYKQSFHGKGFLSKYLKEYEKNEFQ
ncbi:hypothetical protein KAFR_0E03810 [Kazachstania africana CBS 2517]|uniref:chitinase n=1 Tax=Kazachstania africana (strain ATCC 22294 / BCRC 22015 / CBS 2517 / CECT 1963 / NBRC 1671 / NRRL Y-8276) TaxID=1071382 RepID=H2AVY2_KAZAF|nr:hypothetical protein KAFR_0E03810 [Kazachstania africana CBS 2517]CCF58532.1 hypothetical protein KAFR_0E03810 [Kazachstania africana CBS 2517]